MENELKQTQEKLQQKNRQLEKLQNLVSAQKKNAPQKKEDIKTNKQTPKCTQIK